MTIDANMIDPGDSRLLDALRGLRWQARHPPARVAAGAHLSRSLGPAAELSEYRAYRQGDDTRRIDWKLLARTDRAYIRLAQDHAQLGTMLLVDASGSMGWPSDSLAKWRQAGRVALGLAAAARQAGDPVGVTVAQGPAAENAAPDQGPATLRPQNQPAIIPRIAHLLRRTSPQGSVDLAPALLQCTAQRLVVVSDFLGSEADAEQLLGAAAQFRARGREVHAVHVVDEAELNPPATMNVLIDCEDPQSRRVMDSQGRAEYRRRFAEWRAHLAGSWRRQGAQYAMVISREPAEAAVRRIVRGIGDAGRGSR